MKATMSGLFVIGALCASLSAHAQLTSADGGAAVTDGNGLMWANTVGVDLSWSGYPNPQSGTNGAPGSAQAWIAGLNASDYGGYNDWTLATGVGSTSANTTTNQLGELFGSDCGNSAGGSSSLMNSGKNCSAFSALNTALRSDMIFLSSSAYAGNSPSATEFNGNFDFWVYQNWNSSSSLWTDDDYFNQGMTALTGQGDALAVREVSPAPEIDPSAVASGLALLFGAMAVARGRSRASQ
jgi:hypothetical protein